MKKFLYLIGFLIIILAILLQVVLPNILIGMLKEQISHATNAQDVELHINTTPRFLTALGQLDDVHSEVVNGNLGDIETDRLILDASSIKVNMQTLLTSDKLNKPKLEDYIESVDNIKLVGIINEDNLKHFLNSKVSQLDNIEVKILPDEITATSKFNILGRNADIELSGIIIALDGDLYFRMSSLNAKNAILRHVQLDNFIGDIKIVSAEKLPFNLKFDSVQLQNSQAMITAVRE